MSYSRIQNSYLIFQISDIIFQVSDFRCPLIDSELQVSKFKFLFRISRSNFPYFKFHISKFRFHVSTFNFEMSDFYPMHSWKYSKRDFRKDESLKLQTKELANVVPHWSRENRITKHPPWETLHKHPHKSDTHDEPNKRATFFFSQQLQVRQHYCLLSSYCQHKNYWNDAPS